MTQTTDFTLLGVDTGGTFTDFVLLEGEALRIHKVLSTPDDPSRAILQGIRELGLEQALQAGQMRIVHGSTVATNAALERKGVPTAYVTNRGLADVLTLGRQNRPELYNLTPQRQEPPVPSSRCLEVPARLSATGDELEPLGEDDLDRLEAALEALGIEAVAINLLFSYLDPTHEERIQARLGGRWFTSRSSAVLPEAGEYERGIATWLNAWLGPKVQAYLARLDAAAGDSRISMMQSSGGTIALEQAGQRAVNLLLSGPAGGLAAAQYLGEVLEESSLLTFDMGGTSTDVALIDGEVRLTSEGRIGPWPVAVPMVDMHTIGAGGGSLAWIDEGGLLQVGPESAGASPGPVCYGKGGTIPTVTDANLVLGRLRPDAFLGGGMHLDREVAQQAFETLGRQLGLDATAVAEGVIRLANEHMTRALRSISVERGEDPRRFRLCCFGGAGGLHVCALAESLGMTRAVVPLHGGVLSAFGMLVAVPERQLSRAVLQAADDLDPQATTRLFLELEQAGREDLVAEGVPGDHCVASWSLDLRYAGQSFTLNLPWASGQDLAGRFHAIHQARYSHRLSRGVEVVNLRVSVRGERRPLTLPEWQSEASDSPQVVSMAGLDRPVPVRQRGTLSIGECLNGPMLITEQVATTWVAPGWQVQVHPQGHLLLEKM
ncbi:hydantoinase/oxoprolinase family protein [Marinobacteraceae bacterium S3BR75-40.1]